MLESAFPSNPTSRVSNNLALCYMLRDNGARAAREGRASGTLNEATFRLM